MKLIVFNGSPRGKNSNSTVITDWFTDKLKENIQVEICYLKQVNQHDEYVKRIDGFDHILFILPLYTDTMPGIVKAFIEKLEVKRDKLQDYYIGYIIHSGFAEAIQSRALERYLKRLTAILGAKYSGTIIIPGSEGFRIMPPPMTKKKREIICQVGSDWQHIKKFQVNNIKKKDQPSVLRICLFQIMSKLGLTNMYWNQQLKKNNAFHKRFAKPYE